MTRQLRALVCICAAFVVLTAGTCELGNLSDILNKPGKIVVTNTGSDVAVVAILGPDEKSYPTLAAGQSASVATHTGGPYEVRVVMTPENQAQYKQDLNTLRGDVIRLLDGTLSNDEKTTLFSRLAGINVAISALEHANAAGCSGTINLNRETEETVMASIAFQRAVGSGFWDSSCGSN